jgi:hypothetical protein
VIADSTLKWTVHLARRRPRQAAIAILVVAAASVAAAYGFQSALLGVLCSLLLVASVSDYLFPVRYTLGAEVIEARGLLHRRRMTWRQVRRVVPNHLGVKLSPLRRPSRLEAYRGIYLWFASNQSEVMATIAHHRASEAAGGNERPSI